MSISDQAQQPEICIGPILVIPDYGFLDSDSYFDRAVALICPSLEQLEKDFEDGE